MGLGELQCHLEHVTALHKLQEKKQVMMRGSI